MRIFERTRREIAIAPRVTTVDALGAQIEGFSTARIAARANLFPASGGLERREAGLSDGQMLELTLPAGTQIAPGDGVCIGANAPNWRCVEVQNWHGHCAACRERTSRESGGSSAESVEVLSLSSDAAKTGMKRSEGDAQVSIANVTDGEAVPSGKGVEA